VLTYDESNVSGILNSKSRVFDTVVTSEGRRRLANGGLNVKYVSFTDAATFYAADLTSGSADASARLYLEQCGLPHDAIMFRADEAGNVLHDAALNTKNGQLIAYSFDPAVTGSQQAVNVLSGGAEFSVRADDMLSLPSTNFSRLQAIGTLDTTFDDNEFAVSNSDLAFVIGDDKPLAKIDSHVAHVDQLESVFNDARLSNVANFTYLPPINKVRDVSIDTSDYHNTLQFSLGSYPMWGRTQCLTGAQIEQELRHYEELGYRRVITFDPTSLANNIVGQFFEIGFNTIRKLDVIDFGTYVWLGVTYHAYFVGRLVVDNNETDTFLHIFTIVFG
jgi:hypothetical protein